MLWLNSRCGATLSTILLYALLDTFRHLEFGISLTQKWQNTEYHTTGADPAAYLSSTPLPPESHYKEKLQYRCCKDGLREIPMPYSCTRRSLYITEGWECIRAFRYCCATLRDQPFNTEIPTTPSPTTTPVPTTTAAHIITPHQRIHLSRKNFRNFYTSFSSIWHSYL